MVQSTLFDPRPAKVVELSEYRRQRAATAAETTGQQDTEDPEWVPRQARVLSAGAVAHRERMLRHLTDV